MKVVLFCGGLGMRLREYSDAIPKPMVNIGYRPILWHIMKYYAHFGHKDFVLCLGWKANVIKEFFLNYNECITNDFVMSSGGTEIELLNTDIQDWNISFIDTGRHSNIGQRLRAVRKHVEGEEAFLANYADGLTDLHLPDLINFARESDAIATFLTVKPTYNSFHAVKSSDGGLVEDVEPVSSADVWMNGGFFVLKPAIFDYMREGDELVEAPFRRLIEGRRLYAYRYRGFWGCMDTFKEKELLDEMYLTGKAPWEVWNHKIAEPPGPRTLQMAASVTALDGQG